jgi:predicted aspartyl protease
VSAPRVSLEIVPAPAPLERTYANFWEAALALDYERAEFLATSVTERAYAVALRQLAEGDLPAAQDLLSGLTADPQVAPRARALLVAVAKESATLPEKAFTSRVDRSFVEALLEARKSERWTYPPAPVPLLFERNGLTTPLVPVAVNAAGAMMGVDTGSGLTVIGSHLANAAGAKRLGARAGARDANGDGVSVELALVDLVVGGIRIERHPVLVMDSARLRFQLAGEQIASFDGVLGWNTLSRLRMTMDNVKHTITFERSLGKAPSDGDLFWIGEPYVRTRANNGLPLTLFLDTGASHTALSSPVAAAAGLRGGEKKSTLVSGTAGSRTVDVTVYRNAPLHVGGARIVFGEIHSIEPRSSGYAVRDGVLGADMLASGTIVVDPPARLLLITP